MKDALCLCQELNNNYFDLTLCLEFIEHVDFKCTIQLLGEIKRILKRGGILIISTPNKLSLEGLRGLILRKVFGRPWNAWDEAHKRIYSSSEVCKIISGYFDIVGILDKRQYFEFMVFFISQL